MVNNMTEPIIENKTIPNMRDLILSAIQSPTVCVVKLYLVSMPKVKRYEKKRPTMKSMRKRPMKNRIPLAMFELVRSLQ